MAFHALSRRRICTFTIGALLHARGIADGDTRSPVRVRGRGGVWCRREAASTRDYASCRPWNVARSVAIAEMYVSHAMCGFSYTRCGLPICCLRSRRPGQVSTNCLHHDIQIAKCLTVLQASWAIWACPLPQSRSLCESGRQISFVFLERHNQHTIALACLGLG